VHKTADKIHGRTGSRTKEEDANKIRYVLSTLKIFTHYKILFFIWRNSPPPFPMGQGLLIHEISRSHTTTDHSRQDSSGRVISSSQRPLPGNTQQSEQMGHPCPGGIQTQNLSRQAAADLRAATGIGIKYHYCDKINNNEIEEQTTLQGKLIYMFKF